MAEPRDIRAAVIRRWCRAASLAALALPLVAFAQEATVSAIARGSFTVDLKPLAEPLAAGGVSLGRLSIDKRFEGDLEAVGAGEMLTALTPVEGSAGYVAIERVTGILHGREGSFVFQHTGTMGEGVQQLSITVVPDSGTGELSGITGSFSLNIVEGRHFYEFSYELPRQAQTGSDSGP